jgi:hypothetical protein
MRTASDNVGFSHYLPRIVDGNGMSGSSTQGTEFNQSVAI